VFCAWVIPSGGGSSGAHGEVMDLQLARQLGATAPSTLDGHPRRETNTMCTAPVARRSAYRIMGGVTRSGRTRAGRGTAILTYGDVQPTADGDLLDTDLASWSLLWS
jgi:hypothetical protein